MATASPTLPALVFLPAVLCCLAASAHAAPPREITLRECVETALRHNTDIAVARAEKVIGEQGVLIEEAAFLPRFTVETGAARAITPSDSPLTGTLALDQRLFTFNAGVSDLLPTGTVLSLDYKSTRQELTSAVAALAPEYTTALTLSARRALLKNGGRRATEAPLLIARAEAAAKTQEWKAKVMDVVAAARAAYFAFFAAHREVEVRKGALDLAEQLLRQVNARIDTGAAAPSDRLPAQAAVAARREELLRAEAAARNAEDEMKRVWGAKDAAQWEERLVPAPLAASVPPPGPEESFEEAMKRRPEVGAQAAAVASADLAEAAARDRARPSLDLAASAGLSGLSGTPNPNPLFPTGVRAFEGNYADSLDQMFSGRYYNFFLALTAQIPWRLEREKAEWARAHAAAGEQRAHQAALESRIRQEIRRARRDLESALARIDASRASTEAARKKLEAEEEKLALGRSTVTQVLTFQQDLAEARLAEVRAVADAHLARTRLERAAGTILEREGIVLR